MRTKTGGPYCAAIGCSKNYKANPGLHFFRFPKDNDRCRKWIQNTRRADLVGRSSSYCYMNLRLCQTHFEEGMFLRPDKSLLVRTALPTLFDVPNPPPRVGIHRRQLVRSGGDLQPSRYLRKRLQLMQQAIAESKIPRSQRRERHTSGTYYVIIVFLVCYGLIVQLSDVLF